MVNDVFLDSSRVMQTLAPKSDKMEKIPTNAKAKEYLPKPTSPRYLAISIIRKKESILLINSPKINIPAFFTINFACDIMNKFKAAYK